MATIADASPVAARGAEARRRARGWLALAAAMLVAVVAAAGLYRWQGPMPSFADDQGARDWHGNWSVSATD